MNTIKVYKRSLLKMFVLSSFMATLPSFAHHSTTMFDHAKSVVLNGVVKEVQWTNPHVGIFVTGTTQANEESALWLMEMTSPGNLVRDGWKRTSIKAGDKVEVSFSPLRNGSKGGALKKITLIDTGESFTTNIRSAERANLE
jgi:hypothetical protein